MKHIFYFCPCVIFLLFVISSSHAARPFVTDDAGTVSSGAIEIESGADFGHDILSGGMGIKHGLTKRMDIGFAGTYQRFPKNERGFSSAELGCKFSLVPEMLSFSASGSFGDKEYAAMLIMSRMFFSVLALDANMGIEVTDNSNHADMAFGICCHHEGTTFNAGVEISGTCNGDKCLLAGGNVSITKWLAVDLAIITDLHTFSEIWGVAGLTFCFHQESAQVKQKELL